MTLRRAVLTYALVASTKILPAVFEGPRGLIRICVLGRPIVSPAVTQLHAEPIVKDSYLVDFLGLPQSHS
jgi:hypothetical protein